MIVAVSFSFSFCFSCVCFSPLNTLMIMLSSPAETYMLSFQEDLKVLSKKVAEFGGCLLTFRWKLCSTIFSSPLKPW